MGSDILIKKEEIQEKEKLPYIQRPEILDENKEEKKETKKKPTRKAKKADEGVNDFTAEMLLTPLEAFKKQRLDNETEKLNKTYVDNFKISVNACMEKYNTSVISKYPEIPCFMFFIALLFDGVGVDKIVSFFSNLNKLIFKIATKEKKKDDRKNK